MKKYTQCTADMAFDAVCLGKLVQCAADNRTGVRTYQIVEEVPDTPKLRKWAGWMWVQTGQLVRMDANADDDLERCAERGEIVPPSVWMKQ